jgi:hypothetical protein
VASPAPALSSSFFASISVQFLATVINSVATVSREEKPEPVEAVPRGPQNERERQSTRSTYAPPVPCNQVPAPNQLRALYTSHFLFTRSSRTVTDKGPRVSASSACICMAPPGLARPGTRQIARTRLRVCQCFTSFC